MLDSRIQLEKKFNKETHRVIGEVQLQNYKHFLEGFRDQITSLEENFRRPFISKTKLWPVTVSISCKEDMTLMQLVNCDNKLLSRILYSLCFVCQESQLLVDEAKNDLYPALVDYGNNIYTDKSLDSLRYFGKLLDLLQKVQLFIDRSNNVINLIVQQICAMLGKKFHSDSNFTTFPKIFDALADLLVCLVTIDALCTCTNMRENWKICRRAVRSVTNNPVQFDFQCDNVHALDAKLLELEDDLLTGNIMQVIGRSTVAEKSLRTNSKK